MAKQSMKAQQKPTMKVQPKPPMKVQPKPKPMKVQPKPTMKVQPKPKKAQPKPSMNVQPKAKRMPKKVAAWLETPEMQEKHAVPVSTQGLTNITIEMSMAERLQEKKLPQVRGAILTPQIPLKLGSTKGYVHWKIDKDRLKSFVKAESNKLEVGRYEGIMKDAAKMGMLV